MQIDSRESVRGRATNESSRERRGEGEVIGGNLSGTSLDTPEGGKILLRGRSGGNHVDIGRDSLDDKELVRAFVLCRGVTSTATASSAPRRVP